jgi:hypothetical protein
VHRRAFDSRDRRGELRPLRDPNSFEPEALIADERFCTALYEAVAALSCSEF